MHNLAVTGGSINNRSAACHDSDMTAYYDDITGAQTGEAADSGVSSCIFSIPGRSHVTLAHTNLV